MKPSSDVSPRTKGARRCINPDCEFGGRWIAGGMRVLKNGKFSCIGKGCHTVYEPARSSTRRTQITASMLLNNPECRT